MVLSCRTIWHLFVSYTRYMYEYHSSSAGTCHTYVYPVCFPCAQDFQRPTCLQQSSHAFSGPLRLQQSYPSTDSYQYNTKCSSYYGHTRYVQARAQNTAVRVRDHRRTDCRFEHKPSHHWKHCPPLVPSRLCPKRSCRQHFHCLCVVGAADTRRGGDVGGVGVGDPQVYRLGARTEEKHPD